MNHRIVVVIGIAVVAVVAGATLLSAQAPGQPAESGPAQARTHGESSSVTVSGDGAFVREAALGRTAEIDLGKLAGDRALNDQVKALAQRMVTEHGQAGEELKSLAASKQITLPTSLDTKRQATHDRLAKLSGTRFDRAYVRAMLADHKKDVADFEHEASSGKDPAVRAWAARTLPTLQEHLKMAQELDKARLP
jgi:putative membrane protein